MVLKLLNDGPSLINLLMEDYGLKTKLTQVTCDGFFTSVIMTMHNEDFPCVFRHFCFRNKLLGLRLLQVFSEVVNPRL